MRRALLGVCVLLAMLFGVGAVAVAQRSSLVPQYLPAPVAERMRPSGLEGCTAWYLSRSAIDACMVDESHALLASDDMSVMLLTIEHFVDDHPRLDASCHLALHEVGRRWVADEGVRVTELRGLLPATSAVRCSAGFTHGLLIGLLEDRDLTAGTVRDVAEVCRAQPQPMQQKLCLHGLGHSVTRDRGEDVDAGLRACAAAGPREELECAPGVFHEYALALDQLDEAPVPTSIVRSPEHLCAGRRLEVAQACWLWMLHGSAPVDPPRSASATAVRCAKLRSIEERACTTGSAWQWSRHVQERPAQLRECATLAPSLFLSCLQGLRGLNPRADSSYLRVCDALDPTRAVACVEWFGQVLAFYQDASGERDPLLCRELVEVARREACRRGWARGDAPLGVF